MLNSDRVIMLCYFRCDCKSLGSRPILRKMTAALERVNKRIFKLRRRLHMDVRKIECSNRGLWRKANATPSEGYAAAFSPSA